MTRSPRRLRQQLQDTVGEQVRDLPLHAVRLAMFGVGRALLLGDRVTRDYKEITAGGGVRPVLDRLRDDVQGTAEKVVGHVVERVRGDEPEPESGAGAGPEAAPRAKVAEPPARPKPRPAARTSADEISVGKPGGETKADTTTGTGTGSGAEARHTPKHARPGPPPKPAKPGALGRHHAKPAPQAEPAPAPKPADKAEATEKPVPAEKPKPADKVEATEKAEAAKLPVPDYDNATLPQLRARLRGLSADQVRLLREYERENAAREDVVRMYERRIAKLNGTG